MLPSEKNIYGPAQAMHSRYIFRLDNNGAIIAMKQGRGTTYFLMTISGALSRLRSSTGEGLSEELQLIFLNLLPPSILFSGGELKKEKQHPRALKAIVLLAREM